jgi:hypothetical protein
MNCFAAAYPGWKVIRFQELDQTAANRSYIHDRNYATRS